MCTDRVLQGTKTLLTIHEAKETIVFSMSFLVLLESPSICQIQTAIQISQAGRRCVNEQFSRA